MISKMPSATLPVAVSNVAKNDADPLCGEPGISLMLYTSTLINGRPMADQSGTLRASLRRGEHV